LARNSADQADPPKGVSPEMKVWSPEQVRSFLGIVADQRLYAAWRLETMTGMRRGRCSASADGTLTSSGDASP
jgi:hypothetical protein